MWWILGSPRIATKEQFTAATPEKALAGRLRKNCRLRRAPPPATGPKLHGEVIRPGAACPDANADEDIVLPGTAGEIRLRCCPCRTARIHYEGYHQTIIDVLRIDDPSYKESLASQGPVEVLFYVGQDTTATEMPRAWLGKAVERRIGLGLLAGSLLKAIAAMAEGITVGPWDKKPQPTAGRLAKHLDSHIMDFAALALQGVQPRNYRKNSQAAQAHDLEWQEAA